jgi:hypothetical protein
VITPTETVLAQQRQAVSRQLLWPPPTADQPRDGAPAAHLSHACSEVTSPAMISETPPSVHPWPTNLLRLNGSVA